MRSQPNRSNLVMNTMPAIHTIAAGPGQPGVHAALPDELRRTASPVCTNLPHDRKMFAVAVEDMAELERFADDWEALAESAIEPNPCYERWMLEPALLPFGKGKRLIFVFIFAADTRSVSARPTLCGLFPLEVSDRYDGMGKPLPIKSVGLWKHKHCYLCTPLVRNEGVSETIGAFFIWLDEYAHGAALMDFRDITEGPFYRALVDYLGRTRRAHCPVQSFTRALLRPRRDAQDYLREALSREHRKDFRRRERRLAETGALEYAAMGATDDPRPWIEEFLEVDRLSWKGKQGVALTSGPGEREFFETILFEAFARGRLMMLALRYEGRAIACKCNFIAGRGSYAFKIAFDEEYGHVSPGILLEMENIRRLHADGELDWMDSCADPHSTMINRLWLDRLPMQSIAVGLGRRGRLAVALMPLLKWLNRQVFRRDLARRASADDIQIIEA